ncbi:unnamed protein product [Notodromas monacha]|uniref:Uncharacterized protein n=1 Tax=Notodromas monacha TaxID=399045 RepID=A0A7R9GD30_9CRUS|nr:unnamed protein product [Notodromas monacha]CAG0916488.1 unnamed protein product [Notodromas monacha]
MRNNLFSYLRNGINGMFRGRGNCAMRRSADRKGPNQTQSPVVQDYESIQKMDDSDLVGNTVKFSNGRGTNLIQTAKAQLIPSGKIPAACLQNCEPCSNAALQLSQLRNNGVTLHPSSTSGNKQKLSEYEGQRSLGFYLSKSDNPILQQFQDDPNLQNSGRMANESNSGLGKLDIKPTTRKELLTKIVLPAEGDELLSSITLRFTPSKQNFKTLSDTHLKRKSSPVAAICTQGSASDSSRLLCTQSQIMEMIDSIMAEKAEGSKNSDAVSDEEDNVVLESRPCKPVWYGGGTGSCIGMKKKAKRRQARTITPNKSDDSDAAPSDHRRGHSERKRRDKNVKSKPRKRVKFSSGEISSCSKASKMTVYPSTTSPTDADEKPQSSTTNLTAASDTSNSTESVLQPQPALNNAEMMLMHDAKDESGNATKENNSAQSFRENESPADSSEFTQEQTLKGLRKQVKFAEPISTIHLIDRPEADTERFKCSQLTNSKFSIRGCETHHCTTHKCNHGTTITTWQHRCSMMPTSCVTPAGSRPYCDNEAQCREDDGIPTICAMKSAMQWPAHHSP